MTNEDPPGAGRGSPEQARGRQHRVPLRANRQGHSQPSFRTWLARQHLRASVMRAQGQRRSPIGLATASSALLLSSPVGARGAADETRQTARSRREHAPRAPSGWGGGDREWLRWCGGMSASSSTLLWGGCSCFAISTPSRSIRFGGLGHWSGLGLFGVGLIGFASRVGVKG